MLFSTIKIREDFKEALLKRKSFTSAKTDDATPFSRSQARSVALGLARMRRSMGRWFEPNQLLGRRDTIGCIALEITQRCNLDCTLCYLSDNSEDIKDIPLKEVFKRLDGIAHRFGPGVPVQITGGDPTLRKRSELIEIVRYTRELGLQPALFTNGIKATRSLLEDLCAVGLMDIAFHVDITQERKGFSTEEDRYQACQTCHGDVKAMDVVEQVNSLSMGWCVNCHREQTPQGPLNCSTCHN